jgi:hypothetical protein
MPENGVDTRPCPPWCVRHVGTEDGEPGTVHTGPEQRIAFGSRGKPVAHFSLSAYDPPDGGSRELEICLTLKGDTTLRLDEADHIARTLDRLRSMAAR